jgi:hypothetical protein
MCEQAQKPLKITENWDVERSRKRWTWGRNT